MYIPMTPGRFARTISRNGTFPARVQISDLTPNPSALPFLSHSIPLSLMVSKASTFLCLELLHSVGVSCMVIRYTITVQSDLETSDFGFLFLPAHCREIPSDGLALCNEKAENEFALLQ